MKSSVVLGHFDEYRGGSRQIPRAVMKRAASWPPWLTSIAGSISVAVVSIVIMVVAKIEQIE